MSQTFTMPAVPRIAPADLPHPARTASRITRLAMALRAGEIDRPTWVAQDEALRRAVKARGARYAGQVADALRSTGA